MTATPLIAAGLVMIACSPRAAIAPGAICTADNEPAGLACSGGAARRAGDTLFLRSGGGESLFVNNPADVESHVEYRYVGRLTENLHAIDVHGYESVGAIVFDSRGGGQESVDGIPVLSPDGKRLVSVQLSLDVCEGVNVVNIWRLTNDLPTLEWKWQSKECGSDAAWGPDEPKWRAPDTLELTRVENVGRAAKVADLTYSKYPRRRILLVHRDTAWVFVPPAS